MIIIIQISANDAGVRPLGGVCADLCGAGESAPNHIHGNAGGDAYSVLAGLGVGCEILKHYKRAKDEPSLISAGARKSMPLNLILCFCERWKPTKI